MLRRLLQRRRGFAFLLMAAGVGALAVSPSAVAQTSPAAATAPANAPASAEKSYSFEVASIRPDKSGGLPHFGPTANGYQMIHLPLLVAILMAYVPLTNEDGYYTNDRIKGAPDWLKDDQYRIDARVSEADLPEWQKPDRQKMMMRSMLENLMAERTKLVLHRESKESVVFTLEVSKGGPKFKESAADAAAPQGMTLPNGGTLVPNRGGSLIMFYGATMVSLAQVLSNFSGHPVQDKTGLKGKYDFVLERVDTPPAADGTPAAPGPPTYAIEALGLHLERSHSVVDTLVIDHVERPTEN